MPGDEIFPCLWSLLVLLGCILELKFPGSFSQILNVNFHRWIQGLFFFWKWSWIIILNIIYITLFLFLPSQTPVVYTVFLLFLAFISATGLCFFTSFLTSFLFSWLVSEYFQCSLLIFTCCHYFGHLVI